MEIKITEHICANCWETAPSEEELIHKPNCPWMKLDEIWDKISTRMVKDKDNLA